MAAIPNGRLLEKSQNVQKEITCQLFIGQLFIACMHCMDCSYALSMCTIMLQRIFLLLNLCVDKRDISVKSGHR